jgi:hypothetical protein
MAEKLEQTVEVTERDFVNFIGKNAGKYLRRFRKFNVDGVDKFAWTWHWPAFFFGFWWIWYRKLYVWALIGFFLVFIPYWIFVSSLVYGSIANYVYYKHAKKKIIKYKTAKAPVDPNKAAIALRKKGGVSRWAKVLAVFTILLIIGVHVYSAFYGHSGSSYNARAQGDLDKAALIQDAYFEDHGTYADSLDKLLGPEYALYLSNGVTVVVLRADKNSYEMTSFHRRGIKRYTLVGPHGTVKGKFRKWW